jgi:hypothetical protein
MQTVEEIVIGYFKNKFSFASLRTEKLMNNILLWKIYAII